MFQSPISPFAPIPGTERPRRGLFIDRWGTLFEPLERGFATRPSQLAFTNGAVDALFRAQQAGWLVYLIGNEDAVAFGHLAASTWARIEEAMLEHLDANGVQVRRNYACLDHPEGKPPHRRPSVFLLPNTGIFYHAAQKDGIALEQSWVVGDSTLELAAGDRAGCRLAAIRSSAGWRSQDLDVEPHAVAPTLREALLGLLSNDAYARP